MTKSEFLKLTENYDHLIFDFGGIFININYQKTVDAINQICQNDNASKLYSQHSQIDIFSDLEIGKSSEEKFLNELSTLLGLTNKQESLKAAWNSMLLDIPMKRLEFLKELKKNKKIYLLSNINEIHEKHIESIENSKELYSLFDKIYFSHHLKMRKPNAEIFEYVLADLKIAKTDAFFIDDSIGHVTASKSLGIQSVLLEKQNGFIVHSDSK